MAFTGLVALAAGCGGPNGPAVAGSGSSTGNRTSASTNSSSRAMAHPPEQLPASFRKARVPSTATTPALFEKLLTDAHVHQFGPRV
jgi:hypothetical protein